MISTPRTVENDAVSNSHDMAELGQRVEQAKKLLDQSLSWFKTDSASWLEEGRNLLEEVRLMRMALSVELAKINADLKDMKAALGSDETKRSLDALKEFTSVCEHLKTLKEHGAIDPILDYLLKKP